MAEKKNRKHHTGRQASSSHTIIATAPKVLIFTIISGLLLLSLSALIALNSPSALALSGPLALFALYASSIMGGFFCSRMIDAPGSYLCAALSSTLFTLLVIVMKAFIPSSTNVYSASATVALHSLIILSSLLGVIISEKFPERQKRRRKTRS